LLEIHAHRIVEGFRPSALFFHVCGRGQRQTEDVWHGLFDWARSVGLA
jgi:hypothetical protein